MKIVPQRRSSCKQRLEISSAPTKHGASSKDSTPQGKAHPVNLKQRKYEDWVWDVFPETPETFEMFDEVFSLFPKRYDFIYKHYEATPTKEWHNRWSTRKLGWLSNGTILSLWCWSREQTSARKRRSKRNDFCGCRYDWQTRYALIDLDKAKTNQETGETTGGRYHSLAEVNRLRSLLAASGLTRTVVYRSSDSGGFHMYIFFSQAIDSNTLSSTLNTIVTSGDFVVNDGDIEIYPIERLSKNNMGDGVRLPLQRGFAFLDQQTLDVMHDDGSNSVPLDPLFKIQKFLDDVRSNSNSCSDFEQAQRYAQDIIDARQIITAKVDSTNGCGGVCGGDQGEKTVAAEKSGTKVKPLMVLSEAQALASEALPSSEHPDSLEFVQEVFGKRLKGGLKRKWKRWVLGRRFWLNGLTGFKQRSKAIFCLGFYLGSEIRH